MGLLLGGCAVLGGGLASSAPLPEAVPLLSTPTTPPAVSTPSPGTCVVDELLVNSCRPWLGGTAGGYPGTDPGVRGQIEAHEERIQQPIDIVHLYAGVGDLPLDRTERYFATREDTILFQNWKPAQHWAAAAGGDEAVDARIDQAAERIKSIAPKQLFLTLHHEPENDVSSDRACATKPGASFGTTEDYVAMWHHVRERFDASGVTNVVWAISYMNYSAWDCLVPELYPGDAYVDWVTVSAYRGHELTRFDDVIARFRDLLARMDVERGTHAWQKPFGVAEWGVGHASQDEATAYYDGAREAVETGRFPRLKAYLIFDHPGPKDTGGLRTAYADDGTWDHRELATYREFAEAVVNQREGD